MILILQNLGSNEVDKIMNNECKMMIEYDDWIPINEVPIPKIKKKLCKMCAQKSPLY